MRGKRSVGLKLSQGDAPSTVLHSCGLLQSRLLVPDSSGVYLTLAARSLKS